MREAGVGLVTVGVFSWSRIQPRAGTYDWGMLDEVLDLLHGNGIAVTSPPRLRRLRPGSPAGTPTPGR